MLQTQKEMVTPGQWLKFVEPLTSQRPDCCIYVHTYIPLCPVSDEKYMVFIMKVTPEKVI